MPRIAESRKYQTEHLGQLAGKTVKGICYAPADDCMEEIYGLEFTDGTVAWILRDPEGNGQGHLDIEKGKR